MLRSAVVASILACQPGAHATPPAPSVALAPEHDTASRLWLDAQGRLHHATIRALEHDRATLIDAAGRTIRVDRADLLAFLPTVVDHEAVLSAAARPGSRWAWLSLVDGQILPSQEPGDGLSIITPASDPDRLAFASGPFGPVEIPLDRIARLDLAPVDRPGPYPTAAQDDAVELLNGDRLVGLVESIGEHVRIAPPSGPSAVVPLARVRSVTLANPPLVGNGIRVWLAGGAVLDLMDLTIAPDGPSLARPTEGISRVAGAPRDPIAVFAANDLRAILLQPGRVVPLAASTATPTEGSPPWRVLASSGSPLGAHPIELPGPGSWSVSLPSGSMRLLALAYLPRASRVWGDMQLRVVPLDARGVASGEPILPDRRIWGEDPMVELTFDIPPGTASLRWELLAGNHGPVQDRLLLLRALILRVPGAESAAP